MQTRSGSSCAVFLDSSVVIAALLSSSGGSFRICAASRAGTLIAFINRYVYDEVTEVLTRKYPARAGDVAGFLWWCNIIVYPNPGKRHVRDVSRLIHPEDAPILAGALRAKAAFLLTLDRKDFFTATLVRARLPLTITTPREFLPAYAECYGCKPVDECGAGIRRSLGARPSQLKELLRRVSPKNANRHSCKAVELHKNTGRDHKC